jgi:membrane protein DedA with SNARE-associated domain
MRRLLVAADNLVNQGNQGNQGNQVILICRPVVTALKSIPRRPAPIIVSKSATGHLSQWAFSIGDELVPSNGAKSTSYQIAMTSLDLLRQNGLPLVLSTIAASQAGAPAPSATLLMLAAAFARELHLSPWSLLLWVTLTVASVDQLWFWLGRSKGAQVLAWVKKLSPASARAVGAVKRLNRRHGVPLLLVAKFFPGVHTLVIPASAAMKLSYRRFLVISTLGTVLWAGVYIGVGVALGPVVQEFVAFVASSAQWLAYAALVIVTAMVALEVFQVKTAARARGAAAVKTFGLDDAVHS